MTAHRATEQKNMWRLTKSSFNVLSELIDNDHCRVSIEGLRTLRDNVDALVLAAESSGLPKQAPSTSQPAGPSLLFSSTLASSSSSTAVHSGVFSSPQRVESSSKKRGRPTNADLAARQIVLGTGTISGSISTPAPAGGTSSAPLGTVSQHKTPRLGGAVPKPYSVEERALLAAAMERIKSGAEQRIDAVHRLSEQIGRSKAAVQVQLTALKNASEPKPMPLLAAAAVLQGNAAQAEDFEE